MYARHNLVWSWFFSAILVFIFPSDHHVLKSSMIIKMLLEKYIHLSAAQHYVSTNVTVSYVSYLFLTLICKEKFGKSSDKLHRAGENGRRLEEIIRRKWHWGNWWELVRCTPLSPNCSETRGQMERLINCCHQGKFAKNTSNGEKLFAHIIHELSTLNYSVEYYLQGLTCSYNKYVITWDEYDSSTLNARNRTIEFAYHWALPIWIHKRQQLWDTSDA